MFTNTEAFSGFAVDDLEAARKFYGETLGIRTSEQYGLLTLHLAGGRDTLVYPKPDHAPATYTILNFAVDDIDAAVDELISRGVELEKYDGLGSLTNIPVTNLLIILVGMPLIATVAGWLLAGGEPAVIARQPME